MSATRTTLGDASPFGARPQHREEPEEPTHPNRWGTLLLVPVMALWVFAFAPKPIVFVTVPGVVAFLAMMERARSWREAILWLSIFGAVATAIGYRWLAPTLQYFGDVPVVYSWLILALFGVAGILHGWVFAAFYRSMLRTGRRPHPLVTVVLILAVETLPIRLFAWMSGHGAVDVAPIVQAAEWGGLAGVSFVVLCLCVPFHEWLRWAFVRGAGTSRPGAALVTFLVGVALYGVGMLRYQQVTAQEEGAARQIRVGIAQANVGSKRKQGVELGGRAKILANAAGYEAVSRKAAAQGAELIVFPETAILGDTGVPLRLAHVTNGKLDGWGYGFLTELGRDRAFLVGLYERGETGQSARTGKSLETRFNVAALRQPGARDATWAAFRKVHLIPYGEYAPLGIGEERLPHRKKGRGFKMVAGSLPQDPLEYKGLTFIPFVCYEGLLADYVREAAGETRPDVLVSLTNDSWFGDSWEPHQHLNFTRFRAIEHRAPLVRSTNTGISAFVSATGDVKASLGLNEAAALVRQVPIVDRGRTIYVRFGHHLPWLLWILALVAWFAALMRPPVYAEE